MRDPGPARTSLRSGELARLAGVSTDTLRHYERKGVLARPRRGANGYRQYPPGALARVRLVRRALDVGFTLDEIARVLSTRDSGAAPCKEVRALAASKLAEVEERLARLIELRDELRATLKEWDGRLYKTPEGGHAGLLESLAAGNGKSKGRAGKPELRRKGRRRDEK
ncbi:MAG TPA: heavy metal-responsive transcriptional regulator [Pyrinomonadaceae bacterium]|jgi:DNA-binding transcriptional MerR regulator